MPKFADYVNLLVQMELAEKLTGFQEFSHTNLDGCD